MSSKKNRNKIPQNKLDKNYDKLSWIYYIPLLLIAGFVPLIVRGKYVNLTDSIQRYYWTGQVELLDFFSYWKSQWVIILTVIALIIYIILVIMKMAPFKKLWIYYAPLGVYAVFVILSTIFAVDLDTALYGFFDMYQGMWVLLSYVTITFLVINYVNNEKNVKWFLRAFVFLTIVEGLVGVSQYFGFDIFNTPFGNSLIVPSDIQLGEPLTFNFGKFTIYGTLFNTNFVGSFAALMLPMCVVYLVYADKWWTRTIGGIALALGVFTWFGCNSRAGYLAVAVEIIVAAVFLRHYIIKYWKISVAVVAVGLVVLIGFNAVSGGRLIKQISRLNIFSEMERIREDRNNGVVFTKAELNPDSFTIATNKEEITVQIVDMQVSFVDGNNNKIEYTINNKDNIGTFLLNNNMYSNYSFSFDNNTSVMYITAYKKNFSLYVSKDGLKAIGSGGNLIDIEVAESFKPFDGIETFASDRGYEWGRSIPILKSTVFVGKGPDNFIYAFPNNDYLGKLNTISLQPNSVVDKPHNMYLKIGIDTGVISLIAFVALFIIYSVFNIKLQWKKSFENFNSSVSIACTIGCIGYLAAAFFNDNVVSVAPLYWLVLGLGIAINSMFRNKEA